MDCRLCGKPVQAGDQHRGADVYHWVCLQLAMKKADANKQLSDALRNGRI